jgi:hypothetical protein
MISNHDVSIEDISGRKYTKYLESKNGRIGSPVRIFKDCKSIMKDNSPELVLNAVIRIFERECIMYSPVACMEFRGYNNSLSDDFKVSAILDFDCSSLLDAKEVEKARKKITDVSVVDRNRELTKISLRKNLPKDLSREVKSFFPKGHFQETYFDGLYLNVHKQFYLRPVLEDRDATLYNFRSVFSKNMISMNHLKSEELLDDLKDNYEEMVRGLTALRDDVSYNFTDSDIYLSAQDIKKASQSFGFMSNKNTTAKVILEILTVYGLSAFTSKRMFKVEIESESVKSLVKKIKSAMRFE